MSTRYSLRATPRKKELFDGMVETPGRRRSTRQKSEPLLENEDGDSSSAAESTKTRAVRRRTLPKFHEHIDEDDEVPEPIMNGKSANGHVSNGHATNGHTKDVKKFTTGVNGHLNTLKQPDVLPKAGDVIDGWIVGTDPKVDPSGEFEFGGSLGALALMIGFPILMWYMWIGATYYDGRIPAREPGQSWGDFGKHLVNLVYTGAFPTLRAWKIYWTFFIFEGACYCLLPGVWTFGKPLAHEGGKQLKYFCNAYCSFYFTIAVMAALHFSGFFPIYTFLDEFGPLLSVAIASGYLVSFVAYFSAIFRGAQHRMSGHPIYDFFMGAELNPRMFGILDFKMFFEVRLPWFILFGLSAGACARQYEKYGYVSGEALFLLMAHFLYANACAKGEELIPPSWDMYYEKWGFMLIFWNLAGVPLSYCHCTIYIANHHPDEYKWNPYALTALFVLYLFVYWIWDTANSQKSRFRAMERGHLIYRKTFPQLPWQTIHNPKTITSAKGDVLLVDGWFAYARKIFYTCDAFFAICWGLITGFKSVFPWFYPVFFCCMIAHRASRDIRRCRAKYGDAWKEYETQVPYLFIPYVI